MKRLFGLTILVMLAILMAPPGQASATPFAFHFDLDGPRESPPNASPGTGSATVIFDTIAHTLFVDVTFSGLQGVTTQSHIHCCTTDPRTGTSGIATETPTFDNFPLGVTQGTYTNLFDTTLLSSFNAPFVTANGGTAAGAEAALLAGALAGKAYLNIHTDLFPRGEIRGFLEPVPEPGTLGLMAMGITALGILIHRRRR